MDASLRNLECFLLWKLLKNNKYEVKYIDLFLVKDEIERDIVWGITSLILYRVYRNRED